MDVDVEWVERADVPPSLSKKILALKVCRNRCLAHAESDTAMDMATPALKMFFALLENGGSFHGQNDDELVARTRPSQAKIQANGINHSPKVKARMRLSSRVAIALFDRAEVRS